jgi:transcriptional repressor OPI1
MDMQQERPPPPAYTQHEPDTIRLPSVPTHAPLSPQQGDRLPGIRSLDLPSSHARLHPLRASIELSPKASQAEWSAGLPPLSSATFPRVPEGLPRHSDAVDVGSPMDTGSVVSMGDDRRRETSVLSVDDPDVRLAAVALSGLGNPGQYTS